MKKQWYKEPFDFSLSLLGCIFLFPLFLLFAFLIHKEDHGSIFYKQDRVGKNGKRFQILKFRSMSMDSKEIPTHELKDKDTRICVTKVGKFMRSCAMDELPQIINILKGEMSFVGPRPLMPCEVAMLSDQKGLALRLSVLPGLTGLSQTTIDKYMSNDEKLKYDLKYIKEQTFLFDLKLILHSVAITLKRQWEKKWDR
jgi:lipopolysaccharide/colanic/teichoic acid biosynthesis glycosyltransferase